MKKKTNLLLVIFLFISLLVVPEVFAKKINLKFTYWGSIKERKVLDKAIAEFNEVHPDIEVKAIHIPDSYQEKISSMLVAGDPPDVGYLSEGTALEWAGQGELVDLNYFIENDSDIHLDDYLDGWFFSKNNGKKINIGIPAGLETMILFYNKDIFDENGVNYPSSKPGEMTWNEFVDTAKKLTVDQNGNHPDDPGFDPDHVKTYGLSFGTWDWPILPFLWSNGGGLFNEEGTKSIINQTESLEVLQKIKDLMYKYHVAPTPVQSKSFPGFNVLMQSGKVAMAIDGQWSLLDLSQSRFDLGVAPLPVFNKPVALFGGAPLVMFADSEHKEAAWELYKWLITPDKIKALYQNGLWMPGNQNWYTDSAKVEEWIGNEAHPYEYKEAVVDYVLKYTKKSPTLYMKNYNQIRDAFDSTLENFWLNKENVDDAANNLVKKLDKILEGRWDK